MLHVCNTYLHLAQLYVIHGSYVNTIPSPYMDPVCLTPPSSSVTDKRGGRGTGAVDWRCNLAASVMRCASARTSCAACRESGVQVAQCGSYVLPLGFFPPGNSKIVLLLATLKTNSIILPEKLDSIGR